MKRHAGRFFFLTIILILFIFVNVTSLADDYARVEDFRGGRLEDDVFLPMIAAWINADGSLTVTVDGTRYNRGSQIPYLSDDMQVMVPLSFVREVFSCSATVHDGEIRLKRGKQKAVFPLFQAKGEYEAALPLDYICEEFGASYSWDPDTAAAQVDTTLLEAPELPARFDLRKEGRMTPVIDQGTDETCWAYAAAEAVMSSGLPQHKRNVSPESIVKKTGISYGDESGGDYVMALSYFLSWQGAEDFHIQEARFFNKGDSDRIKTAVMQNGGVTSSLYIQISDSGGATGYYNPNTFGYRYGGYMGPNHDIVIIGWDDNYPASSFYGGAAGDGAYICQNSWGSDFGEDGVFYVSYYDVNIEKQSVSYSLAEGSDNYDIIHQSDRYGWLGQAGYNRSSCFGAAIYQAKADEKLRAAGFYATGEGTSYEIYVVPEFTDTSSLAGRISVASGTLRDAGYYTIPFDKDVFISAGTVFSVVIYVSTPDAQEPLAIEYASGRIADPSAIDISDGKGYFSRDGLSWHSIEKKTGGNLCLKVYADE